jgi:hypothetical protein
MFANTGLCALFRTLLDFMMLSRLLSLALLFIGSLGFAQQIELELKNIVIDLAKPSFRIDKVMDSRKDTSRIGWSVLNKETRGKSYQLKSGLSKSFESYLTKNLAIDSAQVKLVANVTGIVLTEKAKIMPEGSVKLNVQFYREENGMYGKVFETSTYTESVSEFGKDIFTSHERRIRFVLNSSLKKLAASNWQNIKPDYVSLAELQQESFELDTLSQLIKDSLAVFKSSKQKEMEQLSMVQIEFRKGFVPTFVQENKSYRSLWPFGKQFTKLADGETNKLFSNYKSKIKLSVLAFVLGGALVGVSFADPSFEDTGMPNFSLAIPGAAFMVCSFPIYLKSNKLAKATTERYNTALLNR